MAKSTNPRKPATPTGKATAPGQLAKGGTAAAKSFAPGQANKATKQARKKT